MKLEDIAKLMTLMSVVKAHEEKKTLLIDIGTI